jgi:hypothetical protein
MTSWIASGDAAALILILTLFEILGLIVLHRLGLTRLTLAGILPNILAGDFLLLAWLTSLHRAPWPIPAAALIAALASHATDLARRWRQA